MRRDKLDDYLTVYAVTDRSWLEGAELSAKVELAINGGVTFVQLREKKVDFDEFVCLANDVKKVTDKYDVPFVINDNVDVAVMVDADGVHLGQSDEAVEEARKKLGNDKIIGATAHNVNEAVAAERAGADYLGVGACFGSTTKDDTVSLSYDELCRICEHVSIPVVAIGGINENNISMLSGSGISGVAVVSALFASDDIENSAADISRMSKLIKKKPDDWRQHTDKLRSSNIKAAIFDMDGTILDSMPMWERLASSYVRSFGIEPDEDLDIRIKTMTIYAAAEYIKTTYNLPRSNKEIMEDVNLLVKSEYENTLLLKPDTFDFLTGLKAEGYKIALATATEYELAAMAIKRNGLWEIFDELVTCTMAGNSKDYPDVYLMACDNLGVKKEDAMIYEDTYFAINTAKKAGFTVTAVFDRAERKNWCDICKSADYIIEL